MEEKDAPEVNNDEKGFNKKQSQNDNENGNEDNKYKITEAEEQKQNFYYLTKKEGKDDSVLNSAADKRDEENILQADGMITKYAICILLKEDEKEDSKHLKLTLDGIISNFGGLSELGINCENIFIYIFVNEIKNNELIPQEKIKDKLSGEHKNDYLLSHLKLTDDERDITIEVISKKEFMSDIEALKIFYTEIVNNLMKEKKTMITSVITAGVQPSNNALSNLIKICLNSNNKDSSKKINNNCVTVPALEISENFDAKSADFFTKVIKYERVHFNIYDMNFFKSTGAVPVLSLFNTMTINKDMMDYLNFFYGKISISDNDKLPKIDYHDYNLGLFLYQNKINIEYYSKEISGTINYKDFDYKYLCISKYSGYYSNFFEILKAFINSELPIFNKLFLLFQILGLLIEFIYPGLSILVIFSILVEAFDNIDSSPAWFMTLLYIIIYLASGVSSLIGIRYKDTKITNIICYYFMEVYYLFIIICSVPAMDNIKKKKLYGEKYDYIDGFYKFNNAAAGCLITFIFVFAILPIILRIDMITRNIVPMLLYLILGAPMSTSNILIAKIWNSPSAQGGKNIYDKKGLIILFFFLFNLFFGFLSVYIYDRKLRANCVMGLAIFYLIYLVFKTLGIVLSLISNPDIAQLNSQKLKDILEGRVTNQFMARNSSDRLDEERENDDNENKNDNESENNKENINTKNEEDD